MKHSKKKKKSGKTQKTPFLISDIREALFSINVPPYRFEPFPLKKIVRAVIFPKKQSDL